MLTLNQKAAKVIKSLMYELRVSDHLVMPNGEKTINATNLIEALEGAHVGDGTADAALAIAEHAFKAGCAAFEGKSPWASIDDLWSDYDPPEHIKDLA